jgi:hypothetical protein
VAQELEYWSVRGVGVKAVVVKAKKGAAARLIGWFG